MSSRFNRLLHGSMEDVDMLLEEKDLAGDEIRVVLQNLCRSIAALDKRVSELENGG